MGKIFPSAETGKKMPLPTLLLLFMYGCSQDTGILSGTLSYGSGFAHGVNNACYVILDTDDDITNGYTKRLIIPVTTAVIAVAYEIDTSDVADGSYFLLGVYDFETDPGTNMDPEAPGVCEAVKWWGGTGWDPPTAADVSDLSGVYDLALVCLP